MRSNLEGIWNFSKRQLRKLRSPLIRILIFSFIFLGFAVFIELYLHVENEIIVISITGIVATIGYFITHYLEIERKKREEKINFYKQLSSAIRAFIKGGEKEKFVKKFERVYYESWPYISTNVIKRLQDYLALFETWQSQGYKRDSDVLKKLKSVEKQLMKEIRDEVTIDDPVEFMSYDFK